MGIQNRPGFVESRSVGIGYFSETSPLRLGSGERGCRAHDFPQVPQDRAGNLRCFLFLGRPHAKYIRSKKLW
jgi:hypothetical protein